MTNKDSIFFSLIEKVGSKGNYQIMLLIIITIQWYIIGSIMLGPSFFFMQQKPICPRKFINEQQCKNYICSQTPEIRKQFYKHNIDSFAYSFGNQYICQNSSKITLLKSLVYIGSFSSNIIFSYFPDNFGRRFSILLSWFSLTFGLFLVSISFNEICLGIGLFLTGLGVDTTENLGFMYLYQQIENQLRQKYSIVIQAGFCIGGMGTGIIFYYLPHSKLIFTYILFLPALIILIIIYLKFEENPQFNIYKGINITVDSLKRIAKMNGIDQNSVQTQQIAQIHKKYIESHGENTLKMTVCNLFKYKSLRVPTIFFGIIFLSLNFLYYAPELIIDQIGLTIYQNQFLFSLSELANYLVIYYFITNLPRKNSGYPIYIMIILLSFSLLLIKKTQNCNLCFIQFLQITLVCIMRFFICLYFTISSIYSSQYFPSVARGLGGSVSGIIGRTITFMNPTLIKSCHDNNVNPMLLFILFGIIGLISIIPLKQTLNEPLKEQIQELGQQNQNQKANDFVKIEAQEN